MAGATAFPELNTVLAELVDGARRVLRENFCGAYLQGSFATGDGDAFSDVDFIVVTHEEPSDEQQAGLQALHRRIYSLETPWAQHLEGSYAPADRLRSVDWSRAPFFYLDNGAAELIWDSHCNTAVVRWILREHGQALAGPEPSRLVDPVPPSDLRREALGRVHEYADWAAEPTEAGPMSRWKQPYLILTLCRLLFTISEGRVPSKRRAGEWALATLHGRWRDLIQKALDDRADPWGRVHQPAAPTVIRRTFRFADYAVATADRWGEQHSGST